jgi:hypothetical protein
MKPLDFVERTALFQVPDGRRIFRPWGKWGPCYLVEDTERWRFRLGLSLSYVVLLALVTVAGTAGGVGWIWLVGVAWMGGQYALFWVLSRGLAVTDAPVLSNDQRQALVREYSGSLGKKFLWTMLLASTLMSVVGLLFTMAGNLAVGLPAFLFFGVCAAVFACQIRLLHRGRGKG